MNPILIAAISGIVGLLMMILTPLGNGIIDTFENLGSLGSRPLIPDPQTTLPQDNIPPVENANVFKDIIDGLIKWIGGISKGLASGHTNQNIDRAIDSGTNAGLALNEAWFHLHETIVYAILGGSPIPIEMGLVVIISVAVSTILIAIFFWSILKRWWWVVLIVCGIIVFIVIVGVRPFF